MDQESGFRTAPQLSAPQNPQTRTLICKKSKIGPKFQRKVRLEAIIGNTKLSALVSRKRNFCAIVSDDTDSVAGYILFGNKFRDFSLRESDLYGQEIMGMHFEKRYKTEHRETTVHLFDEEKVYRSKQPKVNNFGHWELDLGVRSALPSRKNCRLESEDGSQFILRKPSKRTLEVETREPVNDLCLFALCFGSFMTHN